MFDEEWGQRRRDSWDISTNKIPSSYYVRFDTPKVNDGKRNGAQFPPSSSSWLPLMSLMSATGKEMGN